MSQVKTRYYGNLVGVICFIPMLHLKTMTYLYIVIESKTDISQQRSIRYSFSKATNES